MYKLIKLFSLFVVFLILLSAEIKKEFDIKVELTSTITEEKPKLMPPDKLPYQETKVLDLSSLIFEPPKNLEFANIEPIKSESTISCGEPRDAISYRLGVDYYIKGDYDRAQKELEKVVTTTSSFKPMAEYILGVIHVKKGKLEQALPFFKDSCQFTHVYSKPACESYYALNFMLKGSVPENNDSLWRSVRALTLGEYIEPQCKDAVFVNYCGYVLDFYNGNINDAYLTSTKLKRGIKLFQEGKLSDAEKIFIEYSKPGNLHREIALYYLALIELQRDNVDRGLYYVGILETINRELVKNLYNVLSNKGVAYARLAYSATNDISFLRNAGIIAYNSGQYTLALSNFIEAKSYLYAVYSSVKLGNYKKAYEILQAKRDKSKEDYVWLLESAYWLGYPLEPILLEIKSTYPDLYMEYLGWDHFRKGGWEEAAKFLENPYYKAIALFNAKKYSDVLQVLKDKEDRESRVIKARSALFLGNPRLARTFLKDETDVELYLKALSYFVEGSYEKAIENFQKVSYKSPLKPRALLKTADAFYNMGKLEKSKEVYYEVLKMFPDTEYAQQATQSLIELGDKTLSDEEMEKLLSQAISKEKDPSMVNELKYQLGVLYIKMGNNEKARQTLIELLDTPLENKAILRLAQIEQDTRRKTVLLYKVYKEGSEEERKIARQKLIEVFSNVGDERSLAELLYEGDLDDKAKAIPLFVKLGDKDKARQIIGELMNLGYRTDEFEKALLDILKEDKDRSYIDYLLKSSSGEIRAKALYESVIYYVERGEKKKAMEDILDIVSNYKDTSIYNSAIIKGVEILLSLNAKRDASCFLERYNLQLPSQEELRRLQELRKGLPKCGGR